MKKSISASFPWLTFESIIKFFDPLQTVGVIIPTVIFYYDRIPKSLPRKVHLGVALLIFTVVFLYCLRNKYNEYEKAIAEVLETGYFLNFFEKTALHISQKKQANQPIQFKFNDGTKEAVKADQIKVKVILPLSLSSLEDTIDKVGKITKSGNIDNGAWVFAKKNLNNTITIYEYPRTLTAIQRYLPPKYNYSEEKSKNFHKLFNAKFDKDWSKAKTDIPSDIFIKINQFEE
ncbi:MAG: STING domain-containing protein [Methanosarcinaceae archaeon]